MCPILVLGAGKIGASIAKLLHISGDYRITVTDRDLEALARVAKRAHLNTREIDATSPTGLDDALDEQRAVLSACSFDVNPAIAETACAAHRMWATVRLMRSPANRRACARLALV